MIFELANCKVAVIIGGGHGIGLALAKTLLESQPSLQVFISYRQEARAHELHTLVDKFSSRAYAIQMDPLQNEELLHFIDKLKAQTTQIDLCINTIGTLKDPMVNPEKSLREINCENLLHYFKVNSIITPLLAEGLFPLLKHKGPAIFAALSAKVGSIEDNRMGGWYGYRASKAALNMFIKNIALEFRRRNGNTLALAIHPGTTVTELSKPFIEKTKYQLHSPEESAKNILALLDQQDILTNNHFLSWDGSPLPW